MLDLDPRSPEPGPGPHLVAAILPAVIDDIATRAANPEQFRRLAWELRAGADRVRELK
jgi:hypothetical protein